MVWLGFTLGFIGLHALAYFIWLRDLQFLKRESGIFVYHLWFTVGFSLGSISLAAASFFAVHEAAAMLAVLGIYSLSTLELWSLSQGSYSIAILTFAAQRGTITEVDLPRFSDLGAAKLENRIDALQKLGLIVVSEDRVRLTALGRGAATLLEMLLKLSNISKSG